MSQALSKVLKVRVTPETLDRLRKAATDDGRPASGLARRLIETGLAQQVRDGAPEVSHEREF